MKGLLILTLLTITLSVSVHGQDKGEEQAKKELALALKDKKIHNVISGKTEIIKDEATATKISETILFSIYGEDQILDEKPYEINKIEKYWILTGTLKYDFGGVFLIILDATDGKVIRITHGK
jgi:hypothetical protein